MTSSLDDLERAARDDPAARTELLRQLERRGDARGPALRLALEPPSLPGWSRLAVVAGAAPPAEHAALAAWLDPWLADWPDAMRVAPPLWLAALVAGRDAPLVALCRALVVHRWKLPPGADGIARLAASTAVHNVRRLVVIAGDLGDDGAAALADAENLARLERLELRLDRIGAAGAWRLAESPHLAQLERLCLAENQLDDDATVAIATTTHLPRLAQLDLGWNRLGPHSATTLATQTLAARLTHLELVGNGLGDEGARTLLAASTRFTALRYLGLRENDVLSASTRAALGAWQARQPGLTIDAG